jgi:hypothetical protein
MILNWEAIGAIGEIVGATAVVATLFYLARQINDNSKQVKMASIIELNTLYNDAFLPIYNSEKNMEIWVRGLASPEELSDVEIEIFFLFMRRLINPFETAVVQYLEGKADERLFEMYRAYAKEIVEAPGGVAWLAATPRILTADTSRLLGQTEIG